MIRLLFTTLSFSIFILSSLWAVPPVINYAGQVRVAGQPFSGTGYLKFAFVNASGTTTYWSHDGTSVDGSEPTGELSVQVRGGLYSILLGNTALSGMGAIDLSLFQQYDDVHIRVWFNDGERGFQHLRPDRPFASVPYALSAGTAGSAGIAPGSVALNMLASDVQASLSSTIDRSRLSAQVLADLNRTVSLADLSPAVLAEINATIGMDRLGGDVTALLNRTISRSMLGVDVLGDLNATIDRSRLSADVLADLTRTITLSDLAPEVVADLNDSVGPGSITLNHLSAQVLADLNRTVSLADLSPAVLGEINATIGMDRLGGDVTALLNRTISRSMLGVDVLGDLNATIDRSRLSADVLADLTRTITLSDLAPEVVADLNDSVGPGSITLNHLSAQVLADLNRTVSLADLSPAVLGEINATIGMERLGGDVTALLNRTISRSMLGVDVLGDLNATIDRSRLSADVLADLNKTIVITREMLPEDVRSDLNRTFSEEDLSVDVLNKMQLAPSISTQPFARYQWGTDSVIIEVKGNGYQLSYQWFKNNLLIEGEASSVIEITNPDFDANHSYKVKLLNTYGEVNSSAVSLKDAIGVPDPSSNEYNYLITDDLLIHLPFDETSGNIAHDVSGNFHHLEITGFDGATAAWNQGKIGGAFSFDGVDDWGSVPVVLEQNFTMSVWLKTVYAEGYSTQWNYDSFYDRYVGAISGASQTYGLILNYGKIGFWIGSSGNTWSDPRLYSSIDANSGTWHHFVARREGNETDGNYSLFVNGNLDKSVSFTKQITYGSNTYIGRTFNSSLYYDGEMDDLRIYRRALPEAEIQGLYNLGSDPNAIHSYPGAGPGISFVPKEDSITTEHLSEQILKYLRPEVVRSPALPQNREQLYTGQSFTLSADAEGKYLTYQWLRNGQEISGATNKEFTISDANATLHNGNYSVRISNDFGHVSTTSVQLDVNDTQLIHEVDLNASVALEMIWVEPGTFTIGQSDISSASPEHEVTLTQGFYLGKYEVTQAQYEAVMTGNTYSLNGTPSNWPNNPDRPVEMVSWDDIQKFLTLLNTQQAGNIPEGWAYVLPTEAQWEYACRAGTTTAYSWGDSFTTDNANYNDSGYSQTRDVGLYDANPWGFFDMHGNVWEWTADWYAAYSSGTQSDPEGPATGSQRVYRGGSWNHNGTLLRSAFRGSSTPSNRKISIGFRVGFQQVPADVASPEMQILGDANITQLQGVAWVDPGVEAHDVRDGNLSGDVTVSGTVDVDTTGTYTLTYTVSDAAGNQASLTRTVNVGTPATYASDLNASVSLEMIWVDPGTFTMGSPTTEAGRETDETQHEVTLTQGFYLGKYEVTQAQYEAVMTGNTYSLNATPSNWPNNPDRPVEQVSHHDIQKFLTLLNTQQAGNIPEGWAYVLPTEAQWEYACRAGTTTAYSWGDSISASDANWNHGNDANQTENVGQYSANPWGFFDMHGNVREWTADWYAAYSSGAQTDPEGPASGSNRVIRNGSWSNTGTALRSAYRYGMYRGHRHHTVGFRVGFQKIPADVASPEMQILGDANITQLQGVAWVDPGVEAHDVRDGNLSGDVTVSGTVDVDTVGTYTLTYTVSDAAGNQASLTRTVNIVEGQASTHTADLNASVSLEMIWVDPGTFTMGSPTTEAGRETDETQHEVTLTQGFYLGKYEVTQAQYEAVMTGNADSLSATPSQWPNNPDRPVERVSYVDIQKFLTRLNSQQAGNIPEGWAYVLPTEAQWEYACRAGTTTAYSWGDAITSTDANYNNSIGQTADVGQFGANPWGFFDMHGNVWEWTADWYAAYSSGAQTDPEGPASGSNRVRRGGSWSETGTPLRSASRDDYYPSSRRSFIGFRVGFQQQ